MTIPEKHIVAEGRSLRAALEDAAGRLGVPVALVEHKIDVAHFRSASGAGIGAETVKIFAWAKDPASVAPVLAAEEWIRGLLEQMGRTGTVRGESRGGAVVIHVDVGEAGRHIVGRGGATLRALQHLLEANLAGKFAGTQFRIDVARSAEEGEERPRYEDRGDRGDRGDRDRGERSDRGDRGDRGGERREARSDRGDRGDRGERGRGRDRDRGDRGDRPRRGDADVEDLKRLARKVAERVLATGEEETIRRDLNSFDRRIVHVEIQAIAGVASKSVGEGNERRILIVPAPGKETAEGEE